MKPELLIFENPNKRAGFTQFEISTVRDYRFPGADDTIEHIADRETLEYAIGLLRDIGLPICPKCNGSGQDLEHEWPDKTPAACEMCEGYGEVFELDPI